VLTNRNDAAVELINWHFEIEPDVTDIYFVNADSDANAPIILLEVSRSTLATGSVEPFSFGSSEEIPFTTVIAEVTPSEFAALSENPALLPKGWSLEKAERFTRPAELG